MKKKILAMIVAVGGFGIIVAIPATSVAATAKCLPTSYNEGACQTKNVKFSLTKTSVGGWKTGKLAFSFTLNDEVQGAYFIKSFTLTLPSTMIWNKTSDVTIAGTKATYKISGGGHSLTVTAKVPANLFKVTAKSGAVKESTAAKKAKSVKIGLKAYNDNGVPYTYSF